MMNIIESKLPAVSYITVDEAYSDQRIDNFLVSRLKGLPKTRLYRLLRKGEIRVNKKRIKPDYRLQAKDVIRLPPIRLAEPSTQQASLATQNRLIDCILYEDKDLLVINKPAGMAVHGGSGISFGVIETLRQLRPNDKMLELVHRLDRDTSGCLLIAKKPSLLKYMHQLIRDNKVTKIYHALVQGDWPRSVKQIDMPLFKNQLSSGERIVTVSAQGKPSLTYFKVLQRFGSATLMEIKPQTGRTHQIRVHAQYAGHPLAADEKYGDNDFNKWIKVHGSKRLFLHAAKLAFRIPESTEQFTVEAPLPSDLVNCLTEIAKA